MLSHVCSRTLAGSLWSGDKSKGTTQNQIHVEGRITCGRQGLPLGRCEKFSSQTGQNICACLVQQLPRLIGLGREYQRHKKGQARGRHHIRGLKKPWCKRRVGCRQRQIWPLTWHMNLKASIICYHKLVLLPQLLKLDSNGTHSWTIHVLTIQPKPGEQVLRQLSLEEPAMKFLPEVQGYYVKLTPLSPSICSICN